MLNEVPLSCLQQGILGALDTLQSQGQLCDLTLISKDNIPFSIHASIAAASSKVFHTYFVTGQILAGPLVTICENNNIVLSDVSSDILSMAVDFMYGKLPETYKNFIQMEDFANTYKLYHYEKVRAKFQEAELSTYTSEQAAIDNLIELVSSRTKKTIDQNIQTIENSDDNVTLLLNQDTLVYHETPQTPHPEMVASFSSPEPESPNAKSVEACNVQNNEARVQQDHVSGVKRKSKSSEGKKSHKTSKVTGKLSNLKGKVKTAGKSSKKRNRTSQTSDINMNICDDECADMVQEFSTGNIDAAGSEDVTAFLVSLCPDKNGQLEDTENKSFEIQEKKISKTKRINHACEVTGCEYSNYRKDMVESHMYLRHGMGEPTHSCDLCGQKYFSQMQLRVHQQRKHSTPPSSMTEYGNSQNIPCPDCGATFTTPNYLESHKLKVHGRGKLYACDDCEFKSPRKKDLQGHLLAKHGKAPPGVQYYQCPYCSYRTVWKKRMEEHEVRHTGEEKFLCMLCGKCYTTRRGLNTHLQYHSSERPYGCPFCSATFKTSNRLRDHKKLVHLEKGVKPFKCGYCDHCASQRGNCKQHIKKYHPGLPVIVIDTLAGPKRGQKDYLYAGLKGENIKESNDAQAAPFASVGNAPTGLSLSTPADNITHNALGGDDDIISGHVTPEGHVTSMDHVIELTHASMMQGGSSHVDLMSVQPSHIMSSQQSLSAAIEDYINIPGH